VTGIKARLMKLEIMRLSGGVGIVYFNITGSENSNTDMKASRKPFGIFHEHGIDLLSLEFDIGIIAYQLHW
jgi:hypothetical protein